MTYYPDESPAFDVPAFDPQDDEPEDSDQGYDKSDPKHPDFHSSMSDLWDNRDKTA